MHHNLLKAAKLLNTYGYHNLADQLNKIAQQDLYIVVSDKINNDPQFSTLLRARKGIDKNLLVDDKPVILIGFKEEARKMSVNERQSIAQQAVEKYAKSSGFSSVSFNGIVKATQEKYSYNPTATVDTSPPQDNAAATQVFSFSLL